MIAALSSGGATCEMAASFNRSAEVTNQINFVMWIYYLVIERASMRAPLLLAAVARGAYFESGDDNVLV